jgi:hypothetical protein
VNTSLFAFATDLHDEGLGTVLDNVQNRAGAGGLTVAASYHEGRDLFPHNPLRKVRFLEGGALFFRPEERRYEGLRIQPHVSELAREAEDVFGELVAEAGRRGMEVHAWTVFLHNDTLGVRNPDCAPRNVFGDAYVTDLCPANPDVRAYTRALAADVARLGVTSIFAESLHYHPLEHGYAHERYFIELGPLSRYLLGLCFCEHCVEAARERGVDADAVVRFAREEVQRVFERAGAEAPREDVTREEAAALAGGHLGGYLEARDASVASLAREAAAAARDEGASFSFMDLSGAVKGYATGRPSGEAAPTIAWKLGVDLAAVGEACGSIAAIGYAADPERLRFDLEAYRAAAPGAAISVAMRPMAPDCDSAENLAAKLRVARELGVERAHFYHYGFMRLESLDLIQAALAAV